MTTVADITKRSLRLLGVLDATESPLAEDSNAAIMAMNAMLQRWETGGLALAWQPAANPSDELPTPTDYDECIAYNLAVRLAPEYAVQLDPGVIAFAASTLHEAKRDRMVAMPLVERNDAPLGFRAGKYITVTDTWGR